MSRFPNEYDDGYDGRESFERADEDRPEDMEPEAFEATAAPGEDLRDPEVLARRAVPVQDGIAQLGRPNHFPQRSAFFTLDQWVHAAENMRNTGGHFASAIGDAMVYADTDNQNRLAFVFRDLIWQYVPEADR